MPHPPSLPQCLSSSSLLFFKLMIATLYMLKQNLVNVHAQLAILHVLMHMLFTQSILLSFLGAVGEGGGGVSETIPPACDI